MKKTQKFLTFLLTVSLVALMFVLCVLADESGYTFAEDGTTRTNIKWTLTTEGSEKVTIFEIDASSTNAPSTVIYSIDPVTGVDGAFGTPIQTGWGTATGVTKIIIKDGITGIHGGFLTMQRTIKTLEIPASLTALTGGVAFEGCRELSSIYVSGGTAEAGVFDLSNVSDLSGNAYLFDGCTKMATLKLSSALTGVLDTEFIKNAHALTELEIPAGVTELKAKSLSNTNVLKTLTILGKDTLIASESVFNGNTAFPAIKAYADSKAAEFAKANGFTFIDLETEEITEGTKPAPSDTPADPPSGGTTPTTPQNPSESFGLSQFNPDECTAYGYVGGQYYDTYWVFYRESKTLKLFSNRNDGGWNETGRCDKAQDGIGWKDYIPEIEYVEIGPRIQKVSGAAFADHTALKEVKLGSSTTQVDPGAFTGCTNLVSVYPNNGTPVEGRLDFSGISKVNSVITTGTPKIKEILLSKSTISIEGTLGFSMRDIYAHTIVDGLIKYAKENGYNLINVNNPEEKYEYYVEMPEDMVMCGDRCGYNFDEATGTMTIYGSGAIWDIVNYYGGGSKNSPWFDIKQQIKHVIISDHITSIGKYAFTQCENLETVQLPALGDFTIFNAAFEKCSNLKSVYSKGNEPIEGTIDLSGVTEVKPWAFSYDYLIANVIVDDTLLEAIDSTAFEENTNLAAIYGVPGGVGETMASNMGLEFYDASTATPEPVTCTPPETTTNFAPITEAPRPGEDTKAPETEGADVTTEDPLFDFEDDETNAPEAESSDLPAASTDGGEGSGSLPIIIVIVAVVVVAAAVACVVVLKKKKK